MRRDLSLSRVTRLRVLDLAESEVLSKLLSVEVNSELIDSLNVECTSK